MLQRSIKTACYTVVMAVLSLFVASMCAAEVDTGAFIGASIGQSFVEGSFQKVYE